MMTLFSHQRTAGTSLTAASHTLALRSEEVLTLGKSLRSSRDCRDWGYRPQLECVRSNRSMNDCLQGKTKPEVDGREPAAATKPIVGGFGPEVVP
jgi:hypothetical protein